MTFLTEDTYIIVPGLIAPTRERWAGTVAQALRVDGDRMWQRLANFCHVVGVEVDVDGDADLGTRQVDDIFADLIAEGWTPQQILSDLLDDPNVRIIQDSERLRLAWRQGTVLPDESAQAWAAQHGQVADPIWEYTVSFEVLDEDGDWDGAVNGPLAGLTDGFRLNPDVEPSDDDYIDTTDEWPYQEAEDRLLAAAGLTRDDLTDETSTPW